MANKRMFSKDITNSDPFLDMPLSAQCLYFHLGMNSDDDGFVSPKSIMRLVQAKDDDLKILIMKGFIIPFKDNVIVITHRKVNNIIRTDRYTPTLYKKHLETLVITNGAYQVDTSGMHSIVEYSIEENRKEENRKENFGKFVKLSQKEFENLKQRFTEKVVLDLIEKIENWIVNKKKGKSPYIDYYMAIINRAKKDNKEIRQLTEKEMGILRENRNTPQGIEAVNKYKAQLSKYTEEELNNFRINALFDYVNNA